MKCCILLFLLFTVQNFPQAKRNTKGAENGYAWLAMDDPALAYSTSRENYLSSILERLRLTNAKYPEIEPLSCKEDISNLNTKENSDKISMNDVVNEIDKFYSRKENLVIPIVFAYCYTIKKFAGAGSEELSLYRNEVLLFCYE